MSSSRNPKKKWQGVWPCYWENGSGGRKGDGSITYLQKGMRCFLVSHTGRNATFLPMSYSHLLSPQFGGVGTVTNAGTLQTGCGCWLCPGVLSGLWWLCLSGCFPEESRPYVPWASANSPSLSAIKLSALGVKRNLFYPLDQWTCIAVRK